MPSAVSHPRPFLQSTSDLWDPSFVHPEYRLNTAATIEKTATTTTTRNPAVWPSCSTEGLPTPPTEMVSTSVNLSYPDIHNSSGLQHGPSHTMPKFVGGSYSSSKPLSMGSLASTSATIPTMQQYHHLPQLPQPQAQPSALTTQSQSQTQWRDDLMADRNKKFAATASRDLLSMEQSKPSKSGGSTSIASYLQIPPSINDSKGSLAEFAAQVSSAAS